LAQLTELKSQSESQTMEYDKSVENLIEAKENNYRLERQLMSKIEKIKELKKYAMREKMLTVL
jgi:hypothetical protein